MTGGATARPVPRTPRSWAVTRERGSAAAFHDRPVPGGARWVEVLEVDAPALVLGSTQPEADVDRAGLDAAGVALVRRRSGGGAVLLRPGEVTWIDVVVPRDDPLWDDDVGRASHWLGHTWRAALASLGEEPSVHEAGLVTTEWSRTVCFAGLGPGEVTVSGAKVVGISQRRTRDAARLQCALLHRWDPGAVVALLALPPGERARAGAALAGVAAGIVHPADVVVDALLAHLPA